MNKIINNNKTKISELCKNHNVISLYAFGSVLSQKFNKKSDIDFVVDIDSQDPFLYSDYYFSLKENLEQLLKRPIDLLEKRALKNPNLIKTIENSQELVYGK